MRTLVTGATGRVGANLAKALTDRGDVAVCMVMPGDPKESKLKALDVEIRYADLTDAEAVAAAVAGVDRIAHCGAVMAQGDMTDRTFLDINVLGAQRLLEAAVAGQVARFVYISSTAAYCTESVTSWPAPESTPLDPQSLYGASKKMAEALVENYHRRYDLPYVILRPSDIRACDEILNGWTVQTTLDVYKRGARDPKAHYYCAADPEPWREVEALAREKGSSLCAATGADGGPWERHSTDVRDMVGAILAALVSNEALGGAFNVAAPEAFPQPELTEYLALKTGQDVARIATPTRRRVNFSVDKISQRFYTPIHTYQRMIDDALALQSGQDIGVIPA